MSFWFDEDDSEAQGSAGSCGLGASQEDLAILLACPLPSLGAAPGRLSGRPLSLLISQKCVLSTGDGGQSPRQLFWVKTPFPALTPTFLLFSMQKHVCLHPILCHHSSALISPYPEFLGPGMHSLLCW